MTSVDAKLGTGWKFAIFVPAVFTLVLATLYATELFYADQTYSRSVLWLMILVRSVLMILILGISAVLFLASVIRNNRLSVRAKNLLTTGFSIFVLVLFLEFTFMFIPKSHSAGITLAERIWDCLYWHPTNSFGFRDHDLPTPDSQDQYVVVLGDSFTEGHGIRFIENRYTDLLQARLGNPYRVLNFGQSGSDSRRQYETLETSPIDPDVLILQYFGNDIEQACRETGKRFVGFEYYTDVPGFARYLVTNSFFLNFVYWLLPHDTGDNRYAEYFVDCYSDVAVVEAHFRDLDLFVEYSIERHIPLLVLIFPFLEENTDVVNRYVPLVGSYFEARGVPVISVADLIQSLSPGDRVVNRSDGHASTKVHEEAAKALYTWFLRNHWRSRGAAHVGDPALFQNELTSAPQR